MTGFSRWSVVAALVLLVVGVPLAWRAVPAEDEQVSATALLARIEAARDHPYSGYAESRGTLSLPVADRFTDLGTLLGGAHPDAGLVAQPELLAGEPAAGHGGEGRGPGGGDDHLVGLRGQRGRVRRRAGHPAPTRRGPAAAALSVAGSSTTWTATT